MSQLLDSLRRAGRRSPAQLRRASGPGPDAILVSMGYSGGRPARRLVALAALGAVLVAVVWFALRWRDSAGPVRPAVESTMPPPSRVPAPPSPVPSPRPAPESQTAAAPTDQPPPVEAPRPGPQAGPTPSQQFQAAVELHHAGEIDRAARLYSALLAREELAAQSHNNLGLIHQQRGELDAAVQQFERAIDREADYARAHNNLGVALLAQGRAAEAELRFRRAAELDPRDPDALVNLSLAEKARGQPEQAKESLLRALGLAPDSAPAHYNLAVLYDQAGETGRAAEHYRAFLDHSGAEHSARAADVRARLEALDKSR